jgi:hypothetical protein
VSLWRPGRVRAAWNEPDTTRAFALPDEALQLTWHCALQSGSGSILASTLGASATIGGLCHAAERPIRCAAGARVEASDILQTTAEVAIALTGFTGIAVALGGRGGSVFAGFPLVRFRILLVASLAALAFSFLPIFWHHLGASASATWAISSSIAAVFMVPIAISDTRSFRTYSEEIPAFERRAAPLIGVLGITLFVSQIVNALVMQSFGLYLAVPLWFVGFSAFSFSRLLFTLQATSGD